MLWPNPRKCWIKVIRIIRIILQRYLNKNTIIWAPNNTFQILFARYRPLCFFATGCFSGTKVWLEWVLIHHRGDCVEQYFIESSSTSGIFSLNVILIKRTWVHRSLMIGFCGDTEYRFRFQIPGPRLNIKTVLSTYGDFHVKDKTAVRTSYL